MKKVLAIGSWLLAFGFTPAVAQHLLSLDSCRAMALRNNKQMGVQQLKQDIAANLRKSARTKYLPHVSAIGTYQFTSEEISILNNEQKNSLSHLGTNALPALSGLGNGIQSFMGHLGGVLGQLGVPLMLSSRWVLRCSSLCSRAPRTWLVCWTQKDRRL